MSTAHHYFSQPAGGMRTASRTDTDRWLSQF